jgi:membrane fusion protein (multidrug efflux system)
LKTTLTVSEPPAASQPAPSIATSAKPASHAHSSPPAAPPPPTVSKKPRGWKIVGWLVVFAVVGLLAWNKLKPAPKPAAPASARGASSGLRVTGVKVTPVAFTESIAANGTLRAEEAVELQTEVNGKIAAINFTEGQRVSQGHILVKIDDSTLQASLRRAQARRELAGFREQRLARLVEEGGVSKQDYDEARGELAVLDAEIDFIRADIKKTEIRAPFDGVAGIRFVSVGSYVNPAARIATLQGITNLKVDFSVPERYAPLVKAGDPMRFTVAGSKQTYTGEVYAVEPRIDVATRSVLLRALCRNPDGALLPGIFARVEYTVQQSEASILVPAIAVLSGLEERSLFVARDGKAQRVQVVTGSRTDSQIQIVQGLAPGDIVLTSGVQQLRSGMPVQVQLTE